MKITMLCCHNSLYGSADISATAKPVFKDIQKIELPCSSRIDPIHVLKAFETGADGVVIIACPDGACKLLRGSRHLKRRIIYMKQLLEEVGINPQRVMLFEPDIPSAQKLEQIISEAKTALSELSVSSPL